MKIRIKNDIGKSAPGLHYTKASGGVDFSRGEEVTIKIINYPGKHHPWLPNNQYSNWDFWVSGDVDLSPIFLAHEIDALILTPQERDSLAEAPFDSAPFEVIVRES